MAGRRVYGLFLFATGGVRAGGSVGLGQVGGACIEIFDHRFLSEREGVPFLPSTGAPPVLEKVSLVFHKITANSRNLVALLVAGF